MEWDVFESIDEIHGRHPRPGMNDSIRAGQLSWVHEVEPNNPKKGETSNLHDQLVSQHHSFLALKVPKKS